MEGRFFCDAVAVLLLVLVSQTGCGPESPAPAAASRPAATADRVATTEPTTTQDDVSEPTTASPDETAALREQIRKLGESALQAENEFRFADAARTWSDLRVQLVRGFGEGTWQVRNCELALAAAEQEASFTPHQLDRLKAIAERQKEVAAALASGDSLAALSIANEVAPDVQELFGEGSWLHTRFLVQLARLNQLCGDCDAAVPLCQQALGEVLRHAGPVHPDLEALHGFLAICFDELKQPELAVANLKKAAALAQATWGENSLEYAYRANELGVALNTQGDHATAARILRACETIRLKALGEDHPLVAHSRLNLGVACMGLRELGTALELTSVAEPVFRKAGAVSRDMLIKALRQKAAILMLLSRPAEAEPSLRELIALVDATERPDRLAIRSELQYRLAVCLGRQGRFADAVVEAEGSLSARSQLLGPANSETLRSRDLLVTLLERTGQTVRADELRGSVQPAGFVAPER